MMVGHGALSTAGYRYGAMAGNDPPVVSSVTKTPEYQAYKAKVDAAATLSDKFKVLGVDGGFYDPDAPNPSVDLRARRVLTQGLITDACVALADGQDVACVLVNALNGVPDNTQYSFLVPTGANVQDICTTKMTIDDALTALAKIDKGATSIVAKGIYTAVPAKYADYKNWLWGRFKDRFVENLNPLNNPLTSGFSPWIVAAAAGVGTLLLIRLLKK